MLVLVQSVAVLMPLPPSRMVTLVIQVAPLVLYCRTKFSFASGGSPPLELLPAIYLKVMDVASVRLKLLVVIVRDEFAVPPVNLKLSYVENPPLLPVPVPIAAIETLIDESQMLLLVNTPPLLVNASNNISDSTERPERLLPMIV